MIKFYKGTYEQLSASLINGLNNICFVTDRQVIYMGGKEYGKDGGAIKVETGTGEAIPGTGARAYGDGTLVFDQAKQSLWRYNGGTDWTKLLDPTLSAADLISSNADASGKIVFTTSGLSDSYQATAGDIASAVTTLESKVSAAYTQQTAISPTSASNTVVVSKDSGIARTAYTLNQDRDLIKIVSGAGTAITPTAAADTILVTEATLAAQTNDILANGLEIRKFETPETGYRATYGLFNNQTGLQLGDNINIIKDQFLKQAGYVIAFQESSNWYEYKDLGSGTSGWCKDGDITQTYSGSSAPAVNTANRYLKLTFAVSASGQVPGEFPADSDDYKADETDNVVYLNINELFDAYTGVSGVTVNGDTNQISAQINATNNEAGTGTGTHFTGAFLKNSAGGLYVEGIKQEITGYIQDLQSSTSDANYKFLTGFGVDATGKLTGDYAQASAANVFFGGTGGNSTLLADAASSLAITTDNVAEAISAIAIHVGNLDYSYNGTAGSTDNTGAVTKYIYAITETDGKIATSAKILDATDLKADSFQGAALSATKVISGDISGVIADKEIGQIYTVSKTAAASGSLQNALETIVSSVNDYVANLTLAATGVSGNVADLVGISGTTILDKDLINNTAVQFIEQENGQVNVKMIDLAASNIGFAGIAGGADYIPVNGYNVAAALSSISQYIGALDVTANDAGTAPSAGTTQAFKVVQTVSQDNGKISATTLDFTAANLEASAVTENLGSQVNGDDSTTWSPVASGAARVGLESGSQDHINDQISNILADYLSFHNAAGQVI